MDAYYPMIKDALGLFLFLGLELSALFLIISAGVSLLQQYIPDSKIQTLLSGGHGRGYLLAALMGSVTPFCSCSTIPMLRGLLKAKVGFGPTLTFLFSSPLLNPIVMGLFLATFGFKVTVTYVSIALGVSLSAGLILDRMDFEKYVLPEQEAPPAGSCCRPLADAGPAGCSPQLPSPLFGPKTSEHKEAGYCCDRGPKEFGQNFSQKIRIAFQDGWRQFKAVWPYLLAGVSLGALIYGFVPSDFIAAHASGDSLFAVPIAAVISIPLYVRAEALIPLSAPLVSKGMGLGAVMALIIGGSGASLTEVILLKSVFRTQMVAAFLVVILGMAVFAGYLFQFVTLLSG